MDPIREIKDRLGDHPELRFTTTDSSVTVPAPTPNGFSVSFHQLSNEFIVHFDGWHEHFESAKPAFDCFLFGFSGKARVAVTYRGRTPVKWVLEHLDNDGWHVDSEVGHLFIPFWFRPKVVYRQNPKRL